MAKKTTELATIDDSWAIASTDEPVAELLRENLGPESVSPFDLPRIKIPAGGGVSFMVPGIGGETAERTLEGIILHTRMTRAWYEESFEEGGGGNPPDCLSEDGIHGIGVQASKLAVAGDEVGSVLCENCQMSRWGSDRRGGGGQDCSSIRPIFLLRRGDLLPVRVNAPSGSVANARRFLLACTMSSLRYYQVVTRISLEKKAQKEGGLEYASLVFEIGSVLDEKSRTIIDEMRTALSSMFQQVTAAAVGKEGGS